jgi:ABC-type transport system involved in cytochrome c biogenesis permease subunit
MPFPETFSPWSFTAGLYAGSLLLYFFRKDRAALALLCAGFALNTLFLAGRGRYLDVLTPLNMVTETYFLPWCIALLSGMIWVLRKDKDLVLKGSFPLTLLSLAALVVPVKANPPSPQHDAFLAPLFFISEAMAHACFILGGWFALVGIVKRIEMPIFNKMIVWGFVLYSLAQVVGAVWAYLGWGAPFQWSERHLQSTSLWCFYAAYLHLHFSSKWTLMEKMRFAAIGPVVVIFFSYSYFIN